jgi:hypothetical protein
MVRGRKPNPSAVNEANGAHRKNPQRRNLDEPKPKQGRPVMPMRLKGDRVAVKAWKDICDKLAEMGVLTVADVFVIEKLAMLESFLDLCWKEKEISTFNRLIVTWKGLLIECGLTPSARVRTKVVKEPEEENPMAELLARMNG